MPPNAMAEILSQFADIIEQSGTPLRMVALLALLLAGLAYLFFKNERTKIKTTVFGTVFVGAFIAGNAVIKAYATETQKVEPEPIPAPIEVRSAESSGAPKRYLIALDGLQSRSVATWARGKRFASFECPRKHPDDFDLVVVSEMSQNIGKRRGKCLGAGSYCDSTTEYCVEYFFKSACYVNIEWHQWYKQHAIANGIPYSKEAVCAKVQNVE